MSEPIKGCPQPDAPELVMRADGYHYKSESDMKELHDKDLGRLVALTPFYSDDTDNAYGMRIGRRAIEADRELNAESHDPLTPQQMEVIADPTLRAVCETYTNTPGGHFVRLQAVAKLVAAPADRGVSVEEGDSTCQELDGCPTEKAVLQRFWREHQSTGTPVAWLLTDKNINHIQVESVQRLIDRARGAHYTNLIIRVNGKDEHYQADWLKHLTRAIPPSNHSADRDVMRQAPNGWKLVPIEPTLDQYNSACRAYSDWQVQCQEEAREHEDERNPSWGYSQPHFTHSDVYRAMLAAVPTPPAEQPPKELDGIDLVDDLCFAIEARAAGQSGSHRIAELKAELIRRLQRCADEPRAEQQGEQEAVAYLDVGREGYLDLGTDKSDDELQKLSPGRHPLYLRPAPSLAELRAKVEALRVCGSHFDGHGNALALILKDAVLAEIDKLGGKV